MSGPLHLFDGYGVEIEYAIVDAGTLAVLPVSDRVLHAVAGAYESEVDQGELAWSNELVLHVLELKTNGPAPALEPLPALFQRDVGRALAILEPLGGRLMPTGMHPWMDPERETRLWPHEYSPVYEAFDRVFGCRGHGWSNLQSTHLNLPFAGDDEFGRLHAAVRLVLPLLPALAASSPLVEGVARGVLDNRLAFYRENARRVPLVTARVVPEPCFTRDAYTKGIFDPLFRAIAPFDPDRILQHEWLNARGAIARFDRSAIEIRLLDTQERPAADVGVCALATEAIRGLVEERHAPLATQQAWPVEPLADLFDRCLRDGDRTRIDDADYLALFGVAAPAEAADVWRALAAPLASVWQDALAPILEQGPLARRILAALDGGATQRDVYARLCDCLARGEPFRV